MADEHMSVIEKGDRLLFYYTTPTVIEIGTENAQLTSSESCAPRFESKLRISYLAITYGVDGSESNSVKFYHF